jgi:hypothetical protein
VHRTACCINTCQRSSFQASKPRQLNLTERRSSTLLLSTMIRFFPSLYSAPLSLPNLDSRHDFERPFEICDDVLDIFYPY